MWIDARVIRTPFTIGRHSECDLTIVTDGFHGNMPESSGEEKFIVSTRVKQWNNLTAQPVAPQSANEDR